jgi:hypothetical protein
VLQSEQRQAQPSRLSESETGFSWSNSLGDFVGLIRFLIIKSNLAPFFLLFPEFSFLILSLSPPGVRGVGVVNQLALHDPVSFPVSCSHSPVRPSKVANL